MSVLHGNLKRLKHELKSFNQAQFGNLTSKVAEKRKELADIQLSVLHFPNSIGLIKKERLLSQKLCDLMHVDKSYFKQKS